MIFRQPGFEAVLDRLEAADAIGVGTPTLAEASLVLAGKTGLDPLPIVGRIVQEFAMAEVPFAAEHWREASDAFLRYGKGRHPAALNFGDCLTYAVAKLSGEPLLALGDDFAQTDLPLVDVSSAG